MDNTKIKLTCFLYNAKLAEQLGITLSDDQDIEAQITIRIDHIGLCREMANADEDTIRTDRCLLELKNSDSIQVKGSYSQITQQLEELGW